MAILPKTVVGLRAVNKTETAALRKHGLITKKEVEHNGKHHHFPPLRRGVRRHMEQEKQYEAPGYMTYREAALMFSLMPESDAAKAIKATVNYYLYGQLPSGLDGVAEKVFQIMRADIDRNNAKYREVCKRNAENINKRWRRA